MRKLILATAGALASAAVIAGASQAWNPTPYYIYTYFSDATFDHEVGATVESCDSNGQITSSTTGTVTQYVDQGFVGYCGSGGGIPR